MEPGSHDKGQGVLIGGGGKEGPSGSSKRKKPRGYTTTWFVARHAPSCFGKDWVDLKEARRCRPKLRLVCKEAFSRKVPNLCN